MDLLKRLSAKRDKVRESSKRHGPSRAEYNKEYRKLKGNGPRRSKLVSLINSTIKLFVVCDAHNILARTNAVLPCTGRYGEPVNVRLQVIPSNHIVTLVSLILDILDNISWEQVVVCGCNPARVGYVNSLHRNATANQLESLNLTPIQWEKIWDLRAFLSNHSQHIETILTSIQAPWSDITQVDKPQYMRTANGIISTTFRCDNMSNILTKNYGSIQISFERQVWNRNPQPPYNTPLPPDIVIIVVHGGTRSIVTFRRQHNTYTVHNSVVQ